MNASERRRPYRLRSRRDGSVTIHTRGCPHVNRPSRGTPVEADDAAIALHDGAYGCGLCRPLVAEGGV